MFQMEKISNSIANKVALELSLNNDNREVIAYGAFVLLQTVLSIILVIIFGCLFHVVIEAIIISFTTSILRKYSGGAHASSPGICTTIGTILCIGQAILISFVVGPMVNLKSVLFLGLLIFVWSYYTIFKLAPVDSTAKPIKKHEKRKRMKKGSILILSGYLMIVAFNIALYISTCGKRLLVYALCLYIGIAWQVFTLTGSGHLVLGKIDTFLNQIINSRRRVEKYEKGK